MALSYILSVTGDCQGTGQGAFYLEPQGGNPPYNIFWTTPSLPSDLLVNNVLKTNLSQGSYLVQIEDSTTPYPQSLTRIFSIGSSLCVTVDSINTTCNNVNGEIWVNSTTSTNSVSFYLYSLTNGYVTSAATSGSHVFNSLPADIYYVDAIDYGGCTGRSSTCIVGPSQTFDFDLYVVNNSTCSATPTGRVYVTNQNGQPPYTYLWTNGGTSSYISGLTPGNYSVTVTDDNGCSLLKSATVINVPPPSITSVIPVQPSCYQSNGQFTATISGGTAPYNYILSNGLSEISYQNSVTFSGLSSGSYSLMIYDGGLCTATTSFSLATVNSFNVDSVVVSSSTCSLQNGIITVRVSGGLSTYTFRLYDQYNNLTTLSNSTGIASFNNLSSGTYHLYINNGTNCQYDTYLDVTNQEKYSITTTSIDTTCGNSNGSLTVQINSGATYPCVVQITNNPPRTLSVSSTTFTNLSGGIYSVTVTDSNGCVQTSLETISSTSSVQFSLLTKGCETKDEGSITAIITQGEPPFTIIWSPNIVGQSGIYVTGLTQDTYSVTITDSQGCSLTKSAQIFCGSLEGNYSIFNICESTFTGTSNTELGISEMFFQGYQDLTSGETNCILNSADFTVLLDVGTSAYTNTFYSSTSLYDYPTNQDFANALETLLESINGIGSIIIDLDKNEIILSTDCEKTLSGLTVSVSMGIEYDICCATTTTTTPLLCDCKQYRLEGVMDDYLYYTCGDGKPNAGTTTGLTFCADVTYGSIVYGGGLTLTTLGCCPTTTTTTNTPPLGTATFDLNVNMCGSGNDYSVSLLNNSIVFYNQAVYNSTPSLCPLYNTYNVYNGDSISLNTIVTSSPNFCYFEVYDNSVLVYSNEGTSTYNFTAVTGHYYELYIFDTP